MTTWKDIEQLDEGTTWDGNATFWDDDGSTVTYWDFTDVSTTWTEQ